MNPISFIKNKIEEYGQYRRSATGTEFGGIEASPTGNDFDNSGELKNEAVPATSLETDNVFGTRIESVDAEMPDSSEPTTKTRHRSTQEGSESPPEINERRNEESENVNLDIAFTTALSVMPFLALIFFGSTSNPVQLADLMNPHSISEQLGSGLGWFVYIFAVIVLVMVLAVVTATLVFTNVKLVANQRSGVSREKRAVLLNKSIWMVNSALLVSSSGVVAVFTASHGDIKYAPLLAFWTLGLLTIYTGAAMAATHLAVRDKFYWQIVIAWTPAWLLFLGLFSSGEKDPWPIILVCLAFAIVVITRFFLDRKQSSPLSSRVVTNVIAVLVGLFIAFSFRSDYAASLLITGTWCNVFAFGSRSFFEDPASRRGPLLVFGLTAISLICFVSVNPISFIDCCTVINDKDSMIASINNRVVAKPTIRRENLKAMVKTLQIGGTETQGQFKPPLSILCYAGGGSRAALFSGLMQERLYYMSISRDDLINRLEDQYMLNAQAQLARLEESLPTLIRREVFVGPKVYLGRLFLAYQTAVSSVSGGSLTAAAVASMQTKHFAEARRSESLPDGPINRLRALTVLFGVRPGTDYSEIMNIGFNPDEQNDEEFLQLTNSIDSNPFMNSLRKHYLSAVVLAGFNPVDARRTAIASRWETEFKFNNMRLDDVMDAERGRSTPFVMFNSAIAESGQRFLLTNLDQDNFVGLNSIGPHGNIDQLMGRSGNERATVYAGLPGLPITHTYANKRWNPRVSDCVFMSSAFPYGFARARVSRTNGRSHFTVLDGGVVDNTGIDSGLALVNESLLTENKNPFSGAFVLSFDSSELPVDPAQSESIRGWDHLRGTSQALWRAERNRSAMLMAGYINALHNRLPGVGGLQAWYQQPQISENGIFRSLKPNDRPHRQQEGDQLSLQDSTIYGYDNLVGPYETPLGIFLIRPGREDADHVATSWHLPTKERRKLYRASLSPDSTIGLRQAMLSYWVMVLKSSTWKSFSLI